MQIHRLATSTLLALSLAAFGCGGSSGADADDVDGDGFSVEDGDCDDNNRGVFPGAPDPCDGLDNNCDGVVDEMYDQDGDGFTTCGGDCRDNDPMSNPAQVEVVDGIDNDCDGIVDNNTSQYDDDGDGFSEDQGDCNDDDPLIGPNAIEVNENAEGEPEGIDNDCDGEIDEGEPACSTEELDLTTPMAFAHAIDVCNEVSDARWASSGIDPRSRGIFDNYGDTYVANMGPDFAVLSSGIAAGDAEDPGWSNNPSTSFTGSRPHPDPQGAIGCSSNDPSNVNDYSELELIIDVPANANSFSFDFNFMSVEFPEYVCTIFDDTFLAMLESLEFSGNASFDSQGNRVSINVGFFDKCIVTSDPDTANCAGDAELVGTGFEGTAGGGTGWLTTTAPVRPGEKIKLTFLIFDEGDRILDSTVLIDNFRWHIEQVDGPITVDRQELIDSGLTVPNAINRASTER